MRVEIPKGYIGLLQMRCFLAKSLWFTLFYRKVIVNIKSKLRAVLESDFMNKYIPKAKLSVRFFLYIGDMLYLPFFMVGAYLYFEKLYSFC